MMDTMHKYDGVGLAAPQVGILKRVIVIDLGEEGTQDKNICTVPSYTTRDPRADDIPGISYNFVLCYLE